MPFRFIWINGPPEVGKTTLTGLLGEFFRHEGWDFAEIHCMDPVYKIGELLSDELTVKTPENRKFIAGLGNLMEERFNTKSNYVALNALHLFAVAEKCAVVAHVRDRPTINKIVNLLGQQPLIAHSEDFLVRAIYVNSFRANTTADNSEDNAARNDTGNYHYRVTNDGSLYDLGVTARNLTQQIINGD